ncbi:glyoxalase/bleomycin resistance protein/dioxygenase superfamily protein [Catellatospora methionotrophica]|uniref:Glyoxalase/bleomycin resistance protein/dioxygenase superfamily protein n=1 Tax=Catellatospora methionotrophica TaxID=121620 RepID=A0A8J3L5B2_9ACTN|nr:VOC family protein [Catellatospora methionotrophica]GIG14727.1 glyoxalase/bleomycin resistance protein/dioxygenase superfamily protein [Catellatospora methionotrophica]
MTAQTEIPDRYRYAVIPHIMVDDAAAAIDFYQRAFGATEDIRIGAPGGGILHAEVTIGRSVLMLGDASVEEAEAGSFAAPTALGGGTSVTLHVYVPDVDSLARRAEAAGAVILQPPTDMFHGDRTVILRDPAGHLWVFLTHLEDVSEEELHRRIGRG